MTSLTSQEEKELVRLINKLSFPTPLPVFEAWCQVFGTVCAEVIVIKNKDKNPEIFLTYRKDKFFKGWHIPGRVCIPTEKIGNTIERVCKEEIKMPITKESFFDWFERPFGKNIGESPRGHEFSFVFTAELKGKKRENQIEKFFPLNKLPKNLLPLQIPIIKKLSYFYKQKDIKQR
ncbi:MAG: NUDIX domain-containing protein [Patescibacteria group bacterium]